MRDVSSEEAANNYTMLVGGAQCSPMDTRFLPPNDSCQTQFAICVGGKLNPFSSIICSGSICFQSRPCSQSRQLYFIKNVVL